MGFPDSARAKWTYIDNTSTGALKAVNMRGLSERFSAFYEASAGCTGTVRMEARAGSSAGPYATIGGTSTSLSTSQVSLQQFAGPLEWVRPYCQAKTTGTITVELFGN